MRRIVGQLAVERRHHMQALAAGRLRPAGQSLGLQQLAQAERRLCNDPPLETWSRIEVEHKRVGMLVVVDLGGPGVDFHHADLDQA